MTSTPSDSSQSGPVSLVIQTRVTDEGMAAYVKWQAKIGKSLEIRSGFLGQQVIAPSPPQQVDWIVIQRFKSLSEAQNWMQSDELHALLAEVKDSFVGQGDIFLRTESEDGKAPVTALISCHVATEDEAGFQAWETRAFKVESQAKGFVGHRLERPVPGIQENWVIALSFDSDQNLEAWLNSSERAALLEQGRAYQNDLKIRKAAYGFDFWSRPTGSPPPAPMFVLKTNLLVLLVLYPTVFLWGYLVSNPFIDSKGAPFWLSLFIGNLFSTQLLGWYVVPWAFKMFGAWLDPKPSQKTNMTGWVVLLALYAASMALYAYILTLPKLTFG